MCVGRFDVDPVFVHGYATMADVIAFGLALVVPDLAAEFRVDGPNVIGRSEIHDAVDDERRGFEDARWSAINPGEGERVDVAGVDLIERAVSAAGVVAVVGGPGIGGRVQQRCGVETLRGGVGRARESREENCNRVRHSGNWRPRIHSWYP